MYKNNLRQLRAHLWFIKMLIFISKKVHARQFATIVYIFFFTIILYILFLMQINSIFAIPNITSVIIST